MASLGVVLLVTFTLAGSASGRTIFVDDSGGAEFTTIQEAVDHAEAGDTIRVWEGEYQENVVVNKKVNLVGNGSDVTTIDGHGIGDVINVTADWVTISGFHVTGSGGHIYPYIIESGIDINAYHSTIVGNNCSNNTYGLSILNANDCIIESNEFHSNYIGIGLYGSQNAVVINNSISDSRWGIYMFRSGKCDIGNNSLYDIRGHSIYLVQTESCSFVGNEIINNGFQIVGDLEDWTSHTIDESNLVNGKPVYHFRNGQGWSVPLGGGQIIIANCSQMNIDNINITKSSIAILVGYSSDLFIVNSTFMANKYYGISLWACFNSTISANQCEGNSDAGFTFFSSTNCSGRNNRCFNNKEYGILLHSSQDCIIQENSCSGYGLGIILESSRDCKILRNNCSSYQGIGIFLLKTSNCSIENNTCSDSDDDVGISLSSSDSCHILNNSIHENFHGIYLHSSSLCTIKSNTIIGNRYGIFIGGSSQNNVALFNVIENNSIYGIDARYNDGKSIDARFNWWGNASGPHHSKNNIGNGDKVTDHVEFDPWLNEHGDSVYLPDDENRLSTMSKIGLIAIFFIIIIIILWELPINLKNRTSK